MDLYLDMTPIERKVSERELHELADNLNKFLTTYIKHIYVEDPKQIELINTLSNIVMYIKTRQYNQIFDNVLVIDYDLELPPPNNNSIPDYEKYSKQLTDYRYTRELPF